MSVIVVVPFRTDHGHRAHVWQWCRTWLWDRLGYDVVCGEQPDDGPFNRSATINSAIRLATSMEQFRGVTPWTVAVIADADTIVPHDRVERAITVAAHTGHLVAPFTSVVELTSGYTANLLAGMRFDPPTVDADRVRVRELEIQSSLLAVPRHLWNHVGGFDTRFRDWGGEDNAFWKACHLLAGTRRLGGPAYHLWHPPAPGKHTGPHYPANLALWRRYHAATTDQELRAVQCTPSELSPTPADSPTPKP